MTVKHLLEQKGQNLWTIDPDATVLDALAKMAEKDIGSLVVMDGEELIGIITERRNRGQAGQGTYSLGHTMWKALQTGYI